jgi:hypothetical protein
MFDFTGLASAVIVAVVATIIVDAWREHKKQGRQILSRIYEHFQEKQVFNRIREWIEQVSTTIRSFFEG